MSSHEQSACRSIRAFRLQPLLFVPLPHHSAIVIPLFERRPQALDRLAPEAGVDVAVDVQRDRDLAVP